jgi:hypothetical protein
MTQFKEWRVLKTENKILKEMGIIEHAIIPT